MSPKKVECPEAHFFSNGTRWFHFEGHVRKSTHMRQLIDLEISKEK
jgi:hypothetical protein